MRRVQNAKDQMERELVAEVEKQREKKLEEIKRKEVHNFPILSSPVLNHKCYL